MRCFATRTLNRAAAALLLVAGCGGSSPTQPEPSRSDCADPDFGDPAASPYCLPYATGAAYNKEQLEGLAESLLPRWEDSDKAIESKRRRAGYQIKAAFRRAEGARTPEDLQEALDVLERIYAPFESSGGGATWTPPEGVTIEEVAP